MIALAAFLIHVLFNYLLGRLVLLAFSKPRPHIENIILSVLIGTFLETLSIFILLTIGISLKAASLSFYLFVIVLSFITRQKKHNFIELSISKGRLQWYEWIVIFSVIEKLSFMLWQLMNTEILAYDAVANWAARARALYSGVNWSFDDQLYSFLGAHLGIEVYPLGTVIWRAMTAMINGQWDDTLVQGQGCAYYCMMVTLTWLVVVQMTKDRLLSAIAVFVVAALPLQVWQAPSGYVDIIIATYLIAAMGAFVKSEFLLLGVLVAGAAWCKREGIGIYMPAFLIGILLSPMKWAARFKNVTLYFLGLASLLPWELYKKNHALSKANYFDFEWHSDFITAVWDHVITAQTSSILWMVTFGTLLFLSIKLRQNRSWYGYLGMFLFIFSTIIYINCFQPGFYEDFIREATIHRLLLQFIPIVTVIIAYGIQLNENSINSNKA